MECADDFGNEEVKVWRISSVRTDGARPDETSSDVYFWAGAPSRAHCGTLGDERGVGVGAKGLHLGQPKSERAACARKWAKTTHRDPPSVPVCTLLPRNGQRAEAGYSTPNDLVRLSQLARVLRWCVRQAHDVVTVADGQGSAVR
eukprot:6186091-Pleurochrysis_carterae.AAC.2